MKKIFLCMLVVSMVYRSTMTISNEKTDQNQNKFVKQTMLQWTQEEKIAITAWMNMLDRLAEISEREDILLRNPDMIKICNKILSRLAAEAALLDKVHLETNIFEPYRQSENAFRDLYQKVGALHEMREGDNLKRFTLEAEIQRLYKLCVDYRQLYHASRQVIVKTLPPMSYAEIRLAEQLNTQWLREGGITPNQLQRIAGMVTTAAHEEHRSMWSQLRKKLGLSI